MVAIHHDLATYLQSKSFFYVQYSSTRPQRVRGFSYDSFHNRDEAKDASDQEVHPPEGGDLRSSGHVVKLTLFSFRCPSTLLSNTQTNHG